MAAILEFFFYKLTVKFQVVVGLWTFKMVYLVPTQYFLIQLQLINHFFFDSLINEKGVSNKKKCNHAQQHHNFRVFHSLSKFVRSLLAAV